MTPARRVRDGAGDFAGFRPAAQRFLRSLAHHNDREWFTAHRETYESELRAPMTALVEEVDVQLATIAPEIIGTPKKSLFRIHRDTRFSNDKRPYKTNAACWFYHRDAGHGVGTAQAHGGAGFYFEIDTDHAMIGGGIWMPPRPTLNVIRGAIDDDPEALPEILASPALKRRFGTLAPEGTLKRMPRGYAETHPAAALLRHQSFTVGRRLTDAELLSPRLPALLARDFARILPLVRWLNGALGLRQAASR